MEVIGAGFGRTGTLSLKSALETLGYGPCYHMSEVWRNPSRAGFLARAAERAAREEAVDWESLLAKSESPCLYTLPAALSWPL